MKVVKTLKRKVLNQTTIFEKTEEIYNEALTFIIQVIDAEFTDVVSITTKEILPSVERLIHATKKNPSPKYIEFDQNFYKFPSYFRRSAISTALGKVKSYRSNLQNWKIEKAIAEKEGKKFNKKPPNLQLKHKEFPVFYKNNMFVRTGETTAQIKLFYKNDWIWVDIMFKGQDLYKRDVYDAKEMNPKLVKNGKKYFLCFSYEKQVNLNKTKLEEQKICSVDLGITNSAVCSILDEKGTILGRKFINQPKEKDRLYRMTNKLRKVQSMSGYVSAPNYWRKINGIQKHIINNTCHEILAFAKKHGADVIVFEYLDKMKIPKGFWGAKKLRFKLRYWRKTDIQKKVEEMAHYVGIRVRRVNPRNTSALAFDGSGQVVRNGKKDLCIFPTEKHYHSDLNASYNIGARYFVREILKSVSEKKRLSLEAKVPSLARRTTITLSSFISLSLVL